MFKDFEYYKDDINEEYLYEMANLNPHKSGLGDIIIWSEHSGILRNSTHSVPRIKLGNNDADIVISISDNPIILSKPERLSKINAKRIFKKGIDYVARNYDIFLKHFNDVDFSFDDESLFDELRKRKEYK